MTYTQEELENKTDHQLNVIVSRLRQLQDKRFYRSYCDNWNACGELLDECDMFIDTHNNVAMSLPATVKKHQHQTRSVRRLHIN